MVHSKIYSSNISYILLLILVISVTSCSIGNKRKEVKDLTNSEIENILSICYEDTIMVLGHFIQMNVRMFPN